MQWNIIKLPALLIVLVSFVFSETSSKTKAPEIGMWVWKKESYQDPLQRAKLIEFSQKNHIQKLLIQVRFEEVEGQLKLADESSWKELLALSQKAGITIEALDGGRTMASAEERATTLKKVDALLAFQKGSPENARFSGFHYDIEPYLCDKWKNGEQHLVMSEFLQTADEIQTKIKKSQIPVTLSYDIPSWYDKKEELSIEFKGKTKNFHQHIQDLSDYVGIMSYRRKASGENSVADLCSAELAYAESTGKRVYAGLETLQLKADPQISFYGEPKESFINTVKDVLSAMGSSKAFGGVFVHHYNSVQEILDGSTLILPSK
ncbi:MAG: hypothetical protein V4507_04055 [Verrucomicrobiota bacterium]